MEEQPTDLLALLSLGLLALCALLVLVPGFWVNAAVGLVGLGLVGLLIQASVRVKTGKTEEDLSEFFLSFSLLLIGALLAAWGLQSSLVSELTPGNVRWRLWASVAAVLLPVPVGLVGIGWLWRKGISSTGALALALAALVAPLLIAGHALSGEASLEPRVEQTQVTGWKRDAGMISVTLATGRVLRLKNSQIEPRVQEITLVWLGPERLLDVRAERSPPAGHAGEAVDARLYGDTPSDHAGFSFLTDIVLFPLVFLGAGLLGSLSQRKKPFFEAFFPSLFAGLLLLFALSFLFREPLRLEVWGERVEAEVTEGFVTKHRHVKGGGTYLIHHLRAKRLDAACLGCLVEGPVPEKLWAAAAPGHRVDVLVLVDDPAVHAIGRRPLSSTARCSGGIVLLAFAWLLVVSL